MPFTENELTIGKVLCDAHYGLLQLEQRIPGFKLIHESRISTPHGRHIAATILGTQLGPRIVTPSIVNKLVYLCEETKGGTYKAIYHWDSEFFSIITFIID